MTKPVNLNRFRKQKSRAANRDRADENAARFGRGKTERELERARSDKSRRDLDGHKRKE
jgi:Domain of unknown function (DUF4169)